MFKWGVKHMKNYKINYIYNKEKNINDIFTKTLKKELKKNFLIEYKSHNELSKKGNTN